jgi:hypothetical protein
LLGKWIDKNILNKKLKKLKLVKALSLIQKYQQKAGNLLSQYIKMLSKKLQARNSLKIHMYNFKKQLKRYSVLGIFLVQ